MHKPVPVSTMAALAMIIIIMASWCAPPLEGFTARPPRNLQRTVEPSPESWVKVETTPANVSGTPGAGMRQGQTPGTPDATPTSGTTLPGPVTPGAPDMPASSPQPDPSTNKPWGLFLLIAVLLLGTTGGLIYYYSRKN